MPRISWRLDAPLTPRATPQAVSAVRKLLKRSAHQNLVKLLQRARPADSALLLEALTPAERDRLLGLMIQERMARRAAEILSQLAPNVAGEVAERLGADRLATLLAELPSDEATRIAEDLPAELAAATLARMTGEAAEAVREQLEHEEKTAGRIMSQEVFSCPASMSVGEVTAALRQASEQSSISLIYLYTVDEQGRLVGVVNLRRLLVSPASTRLDEIMERDVIQLETEAPQEEVARLFEQYGLMALPVVDDDERLVGQVTVDDVIDLLQEEATEELLALSGVAAEERADTPAPRALRLRSPWLLVNLATAFFASWVVSLFEGSIQSLPLLAALNPIVAGMGGNAATQTLTVMVRSLALSQLPNVMRTVIKEALVGIGNGLINGTVCFAVVALFYGNAHVGAILGLAMTINMTVAGLAGTLMPLALKRLGVDPAVASSVFVTTCTDAAGFFSFLGLATLLMHWIQH